ncbi:hypothetical protein CK203_064156 [Vitis vinifera]|uniref:Retrotransposon gag domain-containing protein n=1 Tax=Vitis vinifera TaxID=29760 RepID=A0A438G5P9_VITVI|nr:hypothetical protein CK203_064156 [Vitis vinifera]
MEHILDTVVAATFGALYEVQMMQAIYHFKAQEVNNPMLQTVCNLELKRRSVSPSNDARTMPREGSWKLQGGSQLCSLETSISYLLRVCEGNPRLKITLNGINFVDHFLNQGAPAEHKSAETPIGHESNGAVAGNECQVHCDTILSTCDFHHKLLQLNTSCVCQSGYETLEAAPEDQHSHQGRQDNLNEFRSMRDRMHPPRMSAPSCIVPPTEQLVIRPYLVPLLPTFHGMESENPYAHIKEFEDVCNTFQEGGASIDLMRLKLFPFTLKDKAKIWLNSLRPRSIRSWTDLQAEFLKKFFPTHRTNGLKRQISNFSAKENEKFYECWERYMEAINACPHHGFDTWLLVSYFYDGMSSSMKQLLETMCGGDFMSKNPEEAMDFLSYVADVSRGWDEPTKGEVGKMKSQLNAYNAKLGCII